MNDADLPDGVTPEVQPLYGPTGEIFRYTLRSDKRSVRELKTIQDWVIERNLRSVSGVADIVSFGGEVKTFEVSVNPHQLINYGIGTRALIMLVFLCHDYRSTTKNPRTRRVTPEMPSSRK